MSRACVFTGGHMLQSLSCRWSVLTSRAVRYLRKMDTPYPPQIVHSNMSTGMTFVQRFSPVTGKMEWVQQVENYDYHQEIARSAYADMLHDSERNVMYFDALKDAIKLMHKKGKPAIVLDIGTGTGLLSMMAVSCGADIVTACEAFTPMANCARQVISDNDLADKITLIPKRSTELKVGPDADLTQRANILVTEVFDTELIGEGGIGTFHHAHKELLTKDCIVVPSAANMYVQVVNCDICHRMNKFEAVVDENGDALLQPPPDVTACHGAPAVHDLQLDQLPASQFTPITDPVKVFRFDYSGKGPINFKGQSVDKVKAINSGPCDTIFMWWDLEMDTRDKILLSCAPRWAHPCPEDMPWRDHWMQAVYFPQTRHTATRGDALTLHSCHDDYSLWFDVRPSTSAPAMPMCVCGAHITCGRSRVGMLNDADRNLKFQKVLASKVSGDTVCLCLSDGSLLPLLAARLGAKHVYSVEPNPSGKALVEKYIAHNGIKNVTVLNKRPADLTDTDFNGVKPNLVLGEPFFTTSILPWHNLLYWYARTELRSCIHPAATVLPGLASIRAIAVNFKDLWKIRAPVGICEGFDISSFDEMIEGASQLTDENVEAQPLWEYPGQPMSEEFDVINFDLARPLAGIKTVEREGCVELNAPGTCNGVALWMVYTLDKDTTISTGLAAPPVLGENLAWDFHTRQGVHLLRRPRKVDPKTQNLRLKHKVVFTPKTGEFEFSFKVV